MRRYIVGCDICGQEWDEDTAELFSVGISSPINHDNRTFIHWAHAGFERIGRLPTSSTNGSITLDVCAMCLVTAPLLTHLFTDSPSRDIEECTAILDKGAVKYRCSLPKNHHGPHVAGTHNWKK